MNEADYDGMEVVDSEGQHLGKVERTYVNDAGEARFVELNLGGLLPKHRLVPVEGADTSNRTLQVDYTRDFIADSPKADFEDTLSGDPLAEVMGYYDRSGGHERAASPVGDATAQEDPSPSLGDRVGQAREAVSDRVEGAKDRLSGDMAAEDSGPAPVREVETVQPYEVGEPAMSDLQPRDLGDVIEVPIVEEQIIKRPVVKEVLRIRKTATTEQQTVGADVRREDVVVESDEGVPPAS